MDDIRDIKGPVPLAGGDDFWLLLVVAAVLTVGALAVWRWWRWRATPARRERAAIRRGLRKLAALADGLDDRDYYFRLAELVRRALALRLGCPATAMTLAELAPRLDVLPLAQARAVGDLLARAEAACYAGAPMSPDERRQDAQTVDHLAARGLA